MNVSLMAPLQQNGSIILLRFAGSTFNTSTMQQVYPAHTMLRRLLRYTNPSTISTDKLITLPFKALEKDHFVELEPRQQLQILRYMCDQHFDNEHVLEVYQGHQARLSQLRKDKVSYTMGASHLVHTPLMPVSSTISPSSEQPSAMNLQTKTLDQALRLNKSNRTLLSHKSYKPPRLGREVTP